MKSYKKSQKDQSEYKKNLSGEAEVCLDKDMAKTRQKQGILADTISTGKDMSSIGEHMQIEIFSKPSNFVLKQDNSVGKASLNIFYFVSHDFNVLP